MQGFYCFDCTNTKWKITETGPAGSAAFRGRKRVKGNRSECIAGTKVGRETGNGTDVKKSEVMSRMPRQGPLLRTPRMYIGMVHPILPVALVLIKDLPYVR
jgi:hypothetical protein